MPRLKDTELRVLLVVLRQTWGWKAGPNERRTDNRSHQAAGLALAPPALPAHGAGQRRGLRCGGLADGSGLIVVEDASGSRCRRRKSAGAAWAVSISALGTSLHRLWKISPHPVDKWKTQIFPIRENRKQQHTSYNNRELVFLQQ